MSVQPFKRVYLQSDFPDIISEEDLGGFEIIRSIPDKTGCVPVRRLSDGEYFCLPLRYLDPRRLKLPQFTVDIRYNKPSIVKDRYNLTIKIGAEVFCNPPIKSIVKW